MNDDILSFIRRDYASRVMADYMLLSGRGTVEAFTGDALLLKAEGGRMAALYAGSAEAAEQVIPRLGQVHVVCAETEAIADRLAARGFQKHTPCVTWHRPAGSPIPLPPGDVRPLTDAHLGTVLAHYAHVSAEEARDLIADKALLGAFDNGQLAGFIGYHREGSVGMLEILPAFRRRGLGYLLEAAAINRQIARGLPAYCHVFIDNLASQGLQKKLGLVASQTRCVWMVPDGRA